MTDVDGKITEQKRYPLELCWLAGSEGLQPPAYHSELAAGMDVMAAVTEPTLIPPGGIALIPTGFAVAIAAGYELQVRPRSGLAVKFGVTVVNAPGTIDADYRGEVKVALINLGSAPFRINRGDRIAQIVLAPVCRAEIEIVTTLSSTGRQAGAFGHTGI